MLAWQLFVHLEPRVPQFVKQAVTFALHAVMHDCTSVDARAGSESERATKVSIRLIWCQRNNALECDPESGVH
jgi:hypothetical protein